MSKRIVLAAKVVAQNRAHQIALDIYPKLAAIFSPLVGKTIYKQDGLLAKIAMQLPEFNNAPQEMINFVGSQYSLAWRVRTTAPAGESCVYREITLYIGDVRNSILTGIVACPSLRTDYTVEEIERKRARYQEMKEAANQAFAELYPFENFDL